MFENVLETRLGFKMQIVVLRHFRFFFKKILCKLGTSLRANQ